MNRKNLTAAVLAGVVLLCICTNAQAFLSSDVIQQWSGHDGGNAEGVVDNFDANLPFNISLEATVDRDFGTAAMVTFALHPVHGYDAGTDSNIAQNAPNGSSAVQTMLSMPAHDANGTFVTAAIAVKFDGERKIPADNLTANIVGQQTVA